MPIRDALPYAMYAALRQTEDFCATMTMLEESEPGSRMEVACIKSMLELLGDIR